MISMIRALPLLAVTGLLLALTPLAGCNRAHAGSGPQAVEASAVLKQIESGAAPLIVDVRTPDEFAAGHVPGAINIPFDEMEARSTEIATHKDQEVVLYCRSGRRSGLAAETLTEKGFSKLGLMKGDMPGWERAGYPVER
jgi:phage shock protein E